MTNSTPADLDVRQLVRSALAEFGDQADPVAVAAVVLSRIPPERLEEALVEAIRYRLEDELAARPQA